MKPKIINYIISIILGILYFLSIKSAYLNSSGYNFTEWLINYQDGGFKRRGLFGTLFIFINEITNIKLEYIVFSFLFIVYTAFFFLLTKFIIKRKNNNLLVLSIILLPAGFGMILKDPGVAGRKEILFFLFYLLYILSIHYKIIVKDFIITLFLIVAILNHEASFFYLPIVSFTYLIKNNDSIIPKFKKIFLYQLLPASVVMLILYKFGINIRTENTVFFLKNHGVTLEGLGIFDYDHDKFDILNFYKKHLYAYQLYGISLLLASFIFRIYCKINSIKINKLFLIIQTVFLIPLFCIAIDWGRWINIFFSLLTIFILGEKNLVSNLKKDIIALSIILFNLMWGMLVAWNGFVTFPWFDDFLKKVYWFLYFRII